MSDNAEYNPGSGVGIDNFPPVVPAEPEPIEAAAADDDVDDDDGGPT